MLFFKQVYKKLRKKNSEPFDPEFIYYLFNNQ